MKGAKKTYRINTIRQRRLSKLTYQLFDIAQKEQDFILIISLLTLACAFVTPYPQLAMWFGFALASYSAIANDSIQTIGTFITSNARSKWWHLWLFMGLIFVATIIYSWVVYAGDISYQRLTTQGFAKAPQTFNFLQLFAPIVLLVLTRMYIPISTTFLLLNIFATDAQSIFNVLTKSFYGYFFAFFIAMGAWYCMAVFFDKYIKGKPWKGWVAIQWMTSGLLWSVWLMQDAANIAVFLPRSLNFIELLLFLGFIFLGLGLLFYLRGDRLQRLVNEKTKMTDVRAATLVDFVYVFILYYFKHLNNIPMSTTWVFIGLLGGRELAMSFAKNEFQQRKKLLQKSFRAIKRDLVYAFIGLMVSIMLAVLVNPIIQQKVLILFCRFWNF